MLNTYWQDKLKKKKFLKAILLLFISMTSFKLDLKYKITFKPRFRSVIIQVFIIYQMFALRMSTQKKTAFIIARSETETNERILKQITTSIIICI